LDTTEETWAALRFFARLGSVTEKPASVVYSIVEPLMDLLPRRAATTTRHRLAIALSSTPPVRPRDIAEWLTNMTDVMGRVTGAGRRSPGPVSAR
jgi:hypothetical protein